MQQFSGQIEAALARRWLNLLIQNVRLVNVYTGAMVATDIGVQDSRGGQWPQR